MLSRRSGDCQQLFYGFMYEKPSSKIPCHAHAMPRRTRLQSLRNDSNYAVLNLDSWADNTKQFSRAPYIPQNKEGGDERQSFYVIKVSAHTPQVLSCIDIVIVKELPANLM